MKKLTLAGVLAMALILGLIYTGCEAASEEEKVTGGREATELTANIWGDGTIPEGSEQWFKFTASGSTQYVHVIFGTMRNMDVQLHTSSGAALGNAQNLRSSSGSTDYMSFSVSSGQVYYLKVTGGPFYLGSNSGTFRIAFNSVQFPPGTFDAAASLSAGVWANGNILSDGEQWFRFTASGSTQYLHVVFGTMRNMDVQLHTSSGAALGNAQNLRSSSGSTNYISLLVTSGHVYYIRVTGGPFYLGSNSGTYQIAFNMSETAP